MPLRIEDYALIGNCHTAALVGRDGSIDWLCFPRFDSPACFAALLGGRDNGRFRIAPVAEPRRVERRYRGGTLVLETDFETEDGEVRVIDCMLVRDAVPDVLRIVEGRRGQVPMRMELVIRFDYGSITPWVQRTPHGITAIGGPDMLRLCTPAPLHGEGLTTVADFTVSAGQRVPFHLAWYPSHQTEPEELDLEAALARTEAWWREWSAGCSWRGEHHEAVQRSLITLKAMTYAPTGGIVAAPTTSLPEQIGGVRNWDYRYCWLRDATFTLYALVGAGYLQEASAWREWLVRAVAGDPSKLHIMYGLRGERRLPELTLDWLPGYEGSAPVRIGNAASTQFQLDVYGEVIDAMYQARRAGMGPYEAGWALQRALLDFLESSWTQPDEGIWEVRGPRQQFTHSKVMAWLAFDRAIKSVEHFRLEGPVDRWRALRASVHEQVCREGFSPELGSFVQSYGSKNLDGSLLMIPLIGFLPAADPRVRGTVEAIERHLTADGFVLRYVTEATLDGLPPGEGVFLPCSFWLVDCLVLLGRHDDARRLFERLLAVRNDVGLLAEEYDPEAKRLVGNFPQAFSHIGLVNTVFNLARGVEGPAQDRPSS
jgi:GH15 family glucan-1,4-alpha-glucosidase